jgi:hypothetical protein
VRCSFAIVMSVVMLSVIKLSVNMSSVVKVSIIRLSVLKQSAVILNVVAPSHSAPTLKKNRGKKLFVLKKRKSSKTFFPVVLEGQRSSRSNSWSLQDPQS